MLTCRGADNDIGKARRLPLPTRTIRQLPRDPRRWGVECQDPVAIEVQHSFQPLGQLCAPARGSRAPQLGYTFIRAPA